MKVIQVDVSKLASDVYEIKKHDKVLYSNYTINSREVDLLSSSKLVNVVSILKGCKIIIYVFYKCICPAPPPFPPLREIKYKFLIGKDDTFSLDNLSDVLIVAIGAGGSGGNGGSGGSGGPMNIYDDKYGGGGGGASGGFGGNFANYTYLQPKTPTSNTKIKYTTGVNNGRADPDTQKFNKRTTTVHIINDGVTTETLIAKGGIDGPNGIPGGDGGLVDRGSAADFTAGNGGYGAHRVDRFESSDGNDAINVDGKVSIIGKGGRGALHGCDYKLTIFSTTFKNGGGGGGGGAGGFKGNNFDLTIEYPTTGKFITFNWDSGVPGDGGNGGRGGKANECISRGTRGEPGFPGLNAKSIYENRYGFGGCGGGGGGGGGGNGYFPDSNEHAPGGSPGEGSKGGDGCVIVVYTEDGE